jgi:hypothetical protein
LHATRLHPWELETVQEQLGLKLEKRKGSVDVLVVNRIEKRPPKIEVRQFGMTLDATAAVETLGFGCNLSPATGLIH